MLIDVMNDHVLKQLVHFPTCEKNTLDLIFTSLLPGQFEEFYFPDKLSDHDVISGTLKIYTPPPPQEKTSEEGVLYQKANFESMRKDASDFAKDKYFNGYSDNRSVHENFDLITAFIEESAEKHILSKKVGRLLLFLG